MATAELPSSLVDSLRGPSLLGETVTTLGSALSDALLDAPLAMPSRLTSVPVAGDDWEEDEDYPFFDDDEEEEADEHGHAERHLGDGRVLHAQKARGALRDGVRDGPHRVVSGLVRRAAPP
ncbi:MAG: hypothetical protein ACO396_08865, partial [Phycisphaerales bacterium]